MRLGIEPDYVIPAYEDAPYWLLRESALPVNVDQLQPEDRRCVRRPRPSVRTFDHGLSRPTGFVLPVQRWNAEAKPAWRSERCAALSRGKLFLVPGNSPVGLRLPMKTPASRETVKTYTRSFTSRIRWTRAVSCRSRCSSVQVAHAADPAPEQQTQNEQYRRGRRRAHRLTIEPRDGVLCVFMPPAPKRGGLSRSGRQSRRSPPRNRVPMRIEGYPPPPDPRLT